MSLALILTDYAKKLHFVEVLVRLGLENDDLQNKQSVLLGIAHQLDMDLSDLSYTHPEQALPGAEP